MSEENPAWIFQGFEGSLEAAIAGKAITDALPGHVAGVKVPQAGEPPRIWNLAGTRAIWAIQVRPDGKQPVPVNCEEADPVIVGRLVGA